MEGEPINVALHREASDLLNQALSEIERLRSEADLHRETSHALRDALGEIERLQSEAADLQHTKFDRGLSNSPTLTASATDWFKKFLERKHHPLTLSSAKPAFEWSKHRCMPHEERGRSSRKPNNLSVRYSTQHKVFVFSAGSQMGKY
jgi:hypothetical protein